MMMHYMIHIESYSNIKLLSNFHEITCYFRIERTCRMASPSLPWDIDTATMSGLTSQGRDAQHDAQCLGPCEPITPNEGFRYLVSIYNIYVSLNSVSVFKGIRFSKQG
jgi:hypothetical protein